MNWNKRKKRIKKLIEESGETGPFLSLTLCCEIAKLAHLIKRHWEGAKVDKRRIRDGLANITIYLEQLAEHLEIDLNKEKT